MKLVVSPPQSMTTKITLLRNKNSPESDGLAAFHASFAYAHAGTSFYSKTETSTEYTWYN
jgi:hypothetical protein